MSDIEERRKKLPKELQKYPERKKGCLSDMAGKGDADSRCASHSARSAKIAAIFGEKCPKCRNNSKERMADGQYWCNTCNKRFKPL
jgi:hypothetical protein